MDVTYKTSRDRNAEPVTESVATFIADRITEPAQGALAMGQFIELLLVKGVITMDDVTRIFSRRNDYGVRRA